MDRPEEQGPIVLPPRTEVKIHWRRLALFPLFVIVLWAISRFVSVDAAVVVAILLLLGLAASAIRRGLGRNTFLDTGITPFEGDDSQMDIGDWGGGDFGDMGGGGGGGD